MSTAERRVQLLNLIQAVLPTIVESVVRPDPPRPKREHKVVAYNFSYMEGPVDLTPPEGDGWQLAEVSLPHGLAHWTRVVLIDAEFEEGATIPSAPPEPETEPAASEGPL